MSNKPHDALVRRVFSQPEHARGEIQRMLPPEIVAQIDWSTLALCPGTFIDEALAETASDLLFSVKLGGSTALLYFLFEHPSTADRFMVFRDLAYEVRIWSWWRRDHPDAQALPVILPMLLCHDEHPWSGPSRFEELLDCDAATLARVADLVPRFRILVDDLTVEEDAALRARAMTAVARLALWCLRHCRNWDEMAASMEAWAELFREIRATGDGLGAFCVLLQYLFDVHKRRDELIKKLRAILLPEQVSVMMSISDQFREEGRIEGELKGRIEGERQIVTRVLTRRFGPLPPDASQKIASASPQDLETWADRAVTEATLEAVFVLPNGSK